MLRVERDYKQIRISVREKKGWLTPELKWGILIAFLFHASALSLISIKKWLIPYEPQKVQEIAILLSNLSVKLDQPEAIYPFQPPPTSPFFPLESSPSTLGTTFLFPVEPETSLKGLRLSENLSARLKNAPSLPKERFHVRVKVRDDSGELFYFEPLEGEKISSESEKWLTDLKFSPKENSFVTTGDITLYD